MKKHNILWMALLLAGATTQAQDLDFDNLNSNTGANKTLTFDVSSTDGYRLRSVDPSDKPARISFEYLKGGSWFNTLTVLGDQVGIGTTSPNSGLTVKHTTGFTVVSGSSSWSANLRMTDGFGGTAAQDDLLFATSGGFMFQMDSNSNGVSNVDGFNVYDRNQNSVFTIDEGTGNVGVGGNASNKGRLTLTQGINDSNESGLLIVNSSNGQSSTMWMDRENKLHLDNRNDASRSIILNGGGQGSIGIGDNGTLSGRLSILQKSSDDNTSGIQLKNSSNYQASYFWMDNSNILHLDNSTSASRDIFLNGGGQGSVGIGNTSSPSGRLSIVQLQNDNRTSGIQLQNAGAGQSSYFWMDSNNVLRLDNSNSASRNIALNAWGEGALILGSNNGLGRLSLKQIDGDGFDSGVQIKNSSNGQSTYFWMDNNDKFHLMNSTTGGRSIILNGNGSGKVGIGTLNPDATLTVKGDMHAEEIRVDLSIPADYVFEYYYQGKAKSKPDYKLLSLDEVEAFVQKNQHLPSIPSAQTIKDNGLSIGEMTNLLLQKIEELTLYTLEQEKRIKELELRQK